MKIIQLDTLDLVYKGQHIATLGLVSLFNLKVDNHIQTEPNSLLRTMVEEVNSIQREMDR